MTESKSGGGGLGRWIVWLLTNDHFADVNKYLPWRHPLGILAFASLVAFLCGMYLDPRGFTILYALLAVIALGMAWPGVSVLALSGAIGFEKPVAREGETVAVTLQVRNRWPWAAWLLAVRRTSRGSRGTSEIIASLPAALGLRKTCVKENWVADRRGEFPTEPLTIGSGFPFGLWEARKKLSIESTLLVWPRTFRVGPPPEAGGDEQDQGEIFRDKAGTSGDFLGVRPFRHGDSLRRVHWGQTARHNRLIVCERQANAAPLIQIVLDTDPATHVDRGSDSSREWAIRIAASFFESWVPQGTPTAAVFDGKSFPGGVGSAHVRRLMNALARIPDDGPALAETLDLAGRRSIPFGWQIVIATDVALLQLPAGRLRDPRRLFVVLNAAGFGVDNDSREQSQLPVRPWISIDGPEKVINSVCGRCKEVALVH